jgi:hypothetical protein
MSLIGFIVVAAVVGVLVWAVVTYLPMPDPIKRVIVIGAVVILVLWLLSYIFGWWGPAWDAPPRVRVTP